MFARTPRAALSVKALGVAPYSIAVVGSGNYGVLHGWPVECDACLSVAAHAVFEAKSC